MNSNLLQFAVVAVVAVGAILGRCGGRDLRPSDHGLEFQENSPPAAENGYVQDMRSFFGSPSTSSPPVELPEAKNISDTWLSGRAGGRARDAGKDHVRLGLLVASAVCGLTGAALLAISGVVFLLRLRRRKEGAKTERVSSTSALNTLAENED